MTPRYKKILIAFALIDVIHFLRVIPIIFKMATNIFSGAVSFYPSGWIMTAIQVLFYFSLIFSAYGLLRQKNWGFLLYYFQIPFRLLFWSMSLGFLYVLNNYSESIILFYTIAGIVFLGEILRLILTIKIKIFSKPINSDRSEIKTI